MCLALQEYYGFFNRLTSSSLEVNVTKCSLPIAAACRLHSQSNLSHMPSINASSLRILEIGEVSRMRHAFANTDFFSTFVQDSRKNKAPGVELVSARTLVSLARKLSDPSYDLIVVHASPHGPIEALIRTVFRQNTLSGHFPLFRTLAQQLVRGGAKAPVAVLDLHDSPSILPCNRHLLKAATIYFKRELPPDRWKLFMRAGKTPTFRHRRSAHYRGRLSNIRPISLGIPDKMVDYESRAPSSSDKTIDVFFAGRSKSSSTVRENGARELLELSKSGLRIEIVGNQMTPTEYLDRCARSWLVWAPEGFGWDCFRQYEAALVGSVPLISRQTIERHKPLVDNEHCIYYDLEDSQLTQAVQRALQDRDRLIKMAKAAREHVLRYHTPRALAYHVAETTLTAAMPSVVKRDVLVK